MYHFWKSILEYFLIYTVDHLNELTWQLTHVRVTRPRGLYKSKGEMTVGAGSTQ